MTMIDRLRDAASELAGYASYAEIVGGVTVNRKQVRRYCDEVFAATRDLDAAPSSETLATIAAWCEETFGPVAPERVAKRAAEEMDELLAEPTKVEEAADVVIVLSRYPGLWEAVERKMAVNRARTWRLMGDGTGYHVPDAAPAGETGTAETEGLGAKHEHAVGVAEAPR